MKKIQTQKRNRKGGFIFSFKKDKTFIDLFKDAKKTESNLLSEYQKYVKMYKEHIENLDKLDDYVKDDYEFDSFRKSFELLKKEDQSSHNFKSNPLLLQNYTDITDIDELDDVIHDHILQQIKYLLNKYYSERDRELIRFVSIRNIKTKPEFKIFSIENKMTEYLPLLHNKFQVDYPKMKEVFDQVLEYIKNNTKGIYYEKTAKPVSHKKVKTPKMNALLKEKKKLSNTIKINKKIVKKAETKVEKKLKKKEEKEEVEEPIEIKEKVIKKDISDIKLPTDDPTLPIFHIKMPQKLMLDNE
jgi:hypothetical protein